MYDAKAVKSYVDRELGESCSVQPKNASLKAAGDKLEIIKSHDGGTCEVSTVVSKLMSLKPAITGVNRVTIPVKVIKPAITNDQANALVRQLMTKLSNGVPVTAGASAHTIPAVELLNWIDAGEAEGKLTYGFNSDRAAVYLNQHVAPSVSVKAGISKVTTQDFIETARQDGKPGQILDVVGTLGQLKEYAELSGC